MKIIKAEYRIESEIIGDQMLRAIEVAGRTCYKSEDRITDDSAKKFVAMLIGRGHESVLEHQHISVRFIIDRGVSHELVRHRLASFSQESTRYCNYSKDKHGREVTFIEPCWDMSRETRFCWERSLRDAEKNYICLLSYGWTPQQARSVLPNALKTEIVISTNLRHWREIFRQRTSAAAHPQMREVMLPLLKDLKNRIPVIFDDITA